jgi:site-specific recombinase XerD
LDAALADRLIATATSWRDKALLTLLFRTGQRIGDWSSFAGRHGILGMSLADVDARSQTVTVRLKGARDDHTVPVADDFWPLYHQYLRRERVADASVPAVWIGLRRGRGHPLTYAAFEAALRSIGRKLGANVNAHQFRHTLAQALVDTGGLKVAQEVLGHRHLGTTADVYAHVDQQAMAAALSTVKTVFDAESGAPGAPARQHQQQPTDGPGAQYLFHYDQATVEELDRAALRGPEAGE